MIRERHTYGGKPKKYSRKVFICSCECIVFISKEKTDHVMVKYEIQTTGESSVNKDGKKYSWSTPTIWAKFKKIVELPSVFSKMNEDEYIIYTGYFTRDKVQVPYISNIEILNVNKYLSLKTQEERKKKLKNINKN